eukprot:COSAG02_NODE_2446_length_8839_cov_6.263501_1_plen_203_part_00
MRPTPTPPTDDPPAVPDTVDDTEAPATVPPPDDTDDPFVSPFTGAPGTGFGGAPLIPAPVQATPKFNQRVFAYIGSLPRGEQKKAKDALRNYVYGPGKMQPDDAIKRYKERRARDAQAPIGATDFDELDASDSDAEESDDDILGSKEEGGVWLRQNPPFLYYFRIHESCAGVCFTTSSNTPFALGAPILLRFSKCGKQVLVC